MIYYNKDHEKKKICPECLKPFQASYMESHIKKCHPKTASSRSTEEQKYCYICLDDVDPNLHTKHPNAHAQFFDQFAFYCPKCDRYFKTWPDLYKHFRTVCKTTSLDIYECKTCSRCFFTKIQAGRHSTVQCHIVYNFENVSKFDQHQFTTVQIDDKEFFYHKELKISDQPIERLKRLHGSGIMNEDANSVPPDSDQDKEASKNVNSPLEIDITNVKNEDDKNNVNKIVKPVNNIYGSTNNQVQKVESRNDENLTKMADFKTIATKTDFDSKTITTKTNFFVCVWCNYVYIDMAPYIKHIIRAMEILNKPSDKCRICPQTHHVLNHIKKQKCTLCDLDLSGEIAMMKHMHKHQSKSSHKRYRRKYHCVICFKMLKDNCDAKRHVLSMHGNGKICHHDNCDEVLFSLTKMKEHEYTKHGGESPFKCEQCFLVLRSMRTLVAHEKNHCPGKMEVCPICKKSFPLSMYLKHKNYHRESGKFICTLEGCFKIFRGLNCYESHVNRHKGIDIKKYICELCGGAFRTHASFTQHKLLKHTQGFSFFCDICNKGFKIKRHLMQHMPVHVEEKSHPCRFCTKVFSRSSNLCQHMKRYHPEHYSFKTEKSWKTAKTAYKRATKTEIPIPVAPEFSGEGYSILSTSGYSNSRDGSARRDESAYKSEYVDASCGDSISDSFDINSLSNAANSSGYSVDNIGYPAKRYDNPFTNIRYASSSSGTPLNNSGYPSNSCGTLVNNSGFHSNSCESPIINSRYALNSGTGNSVNDSGSSLPSSGYSASSRSFENIAGNNSHAVSNVGIPLQNTIGVNTDFQDSFFPNFNF